jgi:uncharacterized protein (DUF1501 family)
MWSAGRLAAVHATGLTVANRSHFSAMEEVEEAHPGSSKRIGWLNRLVGAASSHHNPLQGVGLGGGTPPTELSGPIPLMTISSLNNAAISGDDGGAKDPRRRSLHTMWDHDHSSMGTAVRSTMKATTDLGPAKAAADNSANYNGSAIGNALSAAARIIRGNVGVEVITVDQGDWDMHVNLGGLGGGEMLGNATDLGTSIAAFFGDLGTQADKVTLVTISEFGRRTQENGDRGLDHGWGNVMFVAGAGVKGGYYVNRWKGLTNDLESDLHVTTDYRNVLREIVAHRFHNAKTHKIFPGLKPHTLGFMTP